MRTVAAGILTFLLSARLWTREVLVDGQVCGRVHDLWAGRWSPPLEGRDLTGACLDAATWPVRAAEAALLAATVLLLAAAVLAARRAWWSVAVRPQLCAAGVAGLAGAVLVISVAHRVDPGPICPYLRPGQEEWIGKVSQCLAAGGGLTPTDHLFYGALALLAVGATTLYVLLVGWAWRTRVRRQEGWSPCATS